LFCCGSKKHKKIKRKQRLVCCARTNSQKGNIGLIDKMRKKHVKEKKKKKEMLVVAIVATTTTTRID
jgi:hypothetical protein